MWWTISLVVTGISGLWLAGKHWYGWVLYFANEVLWEAYGLATHDRALQIMAPIWAIVGVRNAVVQRKAQRGHRKGNVIPAEVAA